MKHAELLTKLGSGVRKSYGKDDTKIREVLLPLSDAQWIQLCTNEGEYYVGGCCGTSSAIQDEVSGAFRFDSGWFSSRKLTDIAEMWISHGEGGNAPNFDEMVPVEDVEANWASYDPWQRLAAIWHLVKDDLQTSSMDMPYAPKSRKEDRDPIELAFYALDRGLSYANMHLMFDNTPQFERVKEYRMTLYRLFPHLKVLNDAFQRFSEPLAAFGIYDAEGKLLRNRKGDCVYETREEAQEMIDYTLKYEPEFKASIAPVTISLQNGIERL